MWRDSKANALGVEDTHTVEQHLYFLNEILTQENTVYLALLEKSESVVGMMATDGRFLNQLYIHNDYQRVGIGSKLLELAKELSAGKLQLYTFEINQGARAFYERHGFIAIGRGSDNEENLPDILYEWISSESGTT